MVFFLVQFEIDDYFGLEQYCGDCVYFVEVLEGLELVFFICRCLVGLCCIVCYRLMLECILFDVICDCGELFFLFFFVVVVLYLVWIYQNDDVVFGVLVLNCVDCVVK